MGGRKKAKEVKSQQGSTVGDCRHVNHNGNSAALSSSNNFLADIAHGANRHVNFVSKRNHAANGEASGGGGGGGMHRSPSTATLNRMERENYVFWRRPFGTIHYCIMEVACMGSDLVRSILLHPLQLLLTTSLVGMVLGLWLVEGRHRDIYRQYESQLLWCLYWVWLGVLSSVGFGTGLHTFVLYLGPHIAKVTLAAFECNSLDFPEPPYPNDVTCPNGNGKSMLSSSATAVSLWAIMSKIRLESLMWGVGTALGELPPYFMAKAARVSGEEPDDEEYREFREYMKGKKALEGESILLKAKLAVEKFMEEAIRSRIGFLGILAFASVPNPLFDLAGLTCGHFRIPFLTFFGATLIGKAVVKMHLQMLCVVVAFSEHHVEKLVGQLRLVPYVGEYIQAPLKEFLHSQKLRLHRKPTDPIPEQASSKLEAVMQFVVTGMIVAFLASLINSLAQAYHKRICDGKKKKDSKKLQ